MGIKIFGIFFIIIGLLGLLLAWGELAIGFSDEDDFKNTFPVKIKYLLSSKDLDVIAETQLKNFRQEGLRILIYSIGFVLSGIGIIMHKNWARILCVIVLLAAFISNIIGLIKGVSLIYICILSFIMFVFATIYLYHPRIIMKFNKT